MAQVAARSFWQIKATSWAWWYQDAGYGSTLEHNGDKLLLQDAGTNRRIWCAIKFEAFNEPSWTSTTLMYLIAEAYTCLGLMFEGYSRGATPISRSIIAKRITSAWDSSSTIATMRALTTTGSNAYGGGTGRDPSRLMLLDSDSLSVDDPGTYGLLLSVSDVQNVGHLISTATIPVLRFYYRYTPDVWLEPTAHGRPVVTNTTRDMMNGLQPYDRFLISIDGKRTIREPNEENVSIRVLADNPPLVMQSMSYPAPWVPSFATSGSIIASMSETEIDAFKAIQGSPARITTSINDGVSDIELTSQNVLIGDTTSRSDATGELALTSLLSGMFSRLLCKRDPLSSTSIVVDYADERILFIIMSIIMNNSLITWAMLYYDDFVYHSLRFINVWGVADYDADALGDSSVGDAWGRMAPMLGLHTAETGDGCWNMFHPGVYRPSMRVFTFDDQKTVTGTFTRKERGRSSTYSGVVVTDGRDTGAQSSKITSSAEFQVNSEWRENFFSFTVLDNYIFHMYGYVDTDDFEMARLALARQLSQYLCGKCEIYEGVARPGMLDASVGDIMIVTDKNGNLVPATCYEAKTLPAMTKRITAYRFPDYEGLHSVFQEDGILGIWRMDAANLTTERGTDSVWTVGAIPSPTNRPFLPAHWQGQLFGSCWFSNASTLLDNTTGFCDCFDLTMAGLWDMAYADAGTYLVSWWSDTEFIPILMWRDSATTEVLALGIECSVIPHSIETNSMTIVHYATHASGGYTSKQIWSCPEHLFGLSMGVSDDIGKLQDLSVAVMWKDTTIRIYINRQLVMEATDPLFDKTAFDGAFLHASEGRPSYTLTGDRGYTQTMIASLTHIRQDGWIENLQRLNGANGIDPFYGPDDISVLVT